MEKFMTEMTPVLVNAIGLLLVALVGVLVAWVKQKIGVTAMIKIKEETLAKKDLAISAVKFAEQLAKDLEAIDKYTEATEWLADRLVEKGIKITPEEIQGLVLEALRAIKDELGEDWARGGA